MSNIIKKSSSKLMVVSGKFFEMESFWRLIQQTNISFRPVLTVILVVFISKNKVLQLMGKSSGMAEFLFVLFRWNDQGSTAQFWNFYNKCRKRKRTFEN